MFKHSGDRPLYRVKIAPQNRLAREKLKDATKYENVCGSMLFAQMANSSSHLFVAGQIDTGALEQLLTELLYKNGGMENVKAFTGNMLSCAEVMEKRTDVAGV